MGVRGGRRWEEDVRRMVELPSLLVTIFSLLVNNSFAFVIAPPWADDNTNPCSESSWQLVFWPPTGKCYQIFSQGPCPPTQELGFSKDSQKPECRCPQTLPIHWPATDRCYKRHSRGPCPAEQSTPHLSSCPANPTRHRIPALCPLRPVQARTRLLAPGRPVSRSVQPGPLSQR